MCFSATMFYSFENISKYSFFIIMETTACFYGILSSSCVLFIGMRFFINVVKVNFTNFTFIHCFIRAFVKVLCIMTVLPGIFSYVRGAGHFENKTYHDSAAKTNVTNTTRIPRFIGLLLFFTGLVLLVYFIYKFHSKLNLNFTLWDTPEYKIFTLE